MALHIANSQVVAKIERLAKATGLTKTAAVEQAVDRFLREKIDHGSTLEQMRRLLEQMDRIPDAPDAFDPLEWDDQGLPR